MAGKQLLLSIETSTKVCSVALHEEDKPIAVQDLLIEKSHASLLTVMIHNLFENTGRKPDQLSAVALSMGPGSYTGLRIGTSTAKGICYALDIPLIAINSLKAMAYQVKNYNIMQFHLCPMFDARRMEIYCMLLDAEMNIIQPAHSRTIDENSFDNELSVHEIIFFGDGMPKSKNLLVQNRNAYFIENVIPVADTIGFLGLQKLKNREFENTETFEPYYLKEYVTTRPKKKL